MENKVKFSGSTKQLTDEEKHSFLERANASGSSTAFVIAMEPKHVSNPYLVVKFKMNSLKLFHSYSKFSDAHLLMCINIIRVFLFKMVRKFLSAVSYMLSHHTDYT